MRTNSCKLFYPSHETRRQKGIAGIRGVGQRNKQIIGIQNFWSVKILALQIKKLDLCSVLQEGRL